MTIHFGKVAHTAMQSAFKQSHVNGTSLYRSGTYQASTNMINIEIANSFANYLDGKSNKIPTYDYFKSVFDSTKGSTVSFWNNVTISKNYGQKHAEIAIKIERVISDPDSKKSKIRVDVITPQEYKFWFVVGRAKTTPVNDHSFMDDNSLNYDQKRVEMVQKYLAKCSILCFPKSDEASKMPKK